MKQEVLNRIKALGGNIDHVKGHSFAEDWQSIVFDCVLYGENFIDNQWGLIEFCEQNWNLYASDPNSFFSKMVEHYYYPSEDETFGQCFFKKIPFTPFASKSADYQEWNSYFQEDVDLDVIKVLTGKDNPEFIQIFYSFGYPDHYYVAITDSEQEDNPKVLGTDHEEFFIEISEEGTLEELLASFLTQNEFIELVKKFVITYEKEKNKDK